MKNFTIAILTAATLFSMGACKKKGGSEAAEAISKLGEFKESMCKCTDAACAEKVGKDMSEFSEKMAKTANKDYKPTEAEIKSLTELTMAVQECAVKAAGAADPAAAAEPAAVDPAAAGSADPAAAAADVPAECNEYKAAIEKLAACDKIPAEAATSLKTSYDQSAAAWATTPAEGKEALAATCKTGTESVTAALAACN